MNTGSGERKSEGRHRNGKIFPTDYLDAHTSKKET